MEKSKNYTPMLAVLFGAAFVAAFNENIINVGLADIMAAFAVDANTANWLVTGYMIVTAIIVTVIAFLLRKLSLRTLFFLGSGVFVAGCVLSYFAPNFPTLLATRLLQAVGTGVFIPTMMSTVLRVAPRKKLGTYLSIGGCCISFGPAFGPVLSGMMVTFFGWRSMFLVPMIAMAVLLVLGFFLVRNVYEKEDISIDVVSVIMSVVGLTALVFGLAQVSTDVVIGVVGIVVGLLVIVLFVRRQLSSTNPLLDLSPMKDSSFCLACALVVVAMMTTFSMSVLLPLYFEGALGVNALTAGLFILIPILAQAVCSILGGRLLDTRGEWPLLPAGFLLISIGLLAAAWCAPELNAILVIIASTVAYAGVGFAFSPSQSAGLKNLPPKLNPHGVSIMSTFIQMSAAIGPSLFVGVMSSYLASNTSAQVGYSQGFAAAVLVALVFGLIGLVVSVVFSRRAVAAAAAATRTRRQSAAQGGAVRPQLADIMKTDVFSISADAPVYEAVEQMIMHHTSGLPVLDPRGHVVGFVSDGDVMKSVAKLDPGLIDLTYALSVYADDEGFDARMHEVMRANVMELATTHVISVDSSTSIERVCTLLGERRIKKVPVLDGAKLVGTVSRSDVNRHLMNSFIAKGRPEAPAGTEHAPVTA